MSSKFDFIDLLGAATPEELSRLKDLATHQRRRRLTAEEQADAKALRDVLRSRLLAHEAAECSPS